MRVLCFLDWQIEHRKRMPSVSPDESSVGKDLCQSVLVLWFLILNLLTRSCL